MDEQVVPRCEAASRVSGPELRLARLTILFDGTAWTNVASATTAKLRSIATIPGGGLTAVGDNATVLEHP
jgi:hypothetical protein